MKDTDDLADENDTPKIAIDTIEKNKESAWKKSDPPQRIEKSSSDQTQDAPNSTKYKRAILKAMESIYDEEYQTGKKFEEIMDVDMGRKSPKNFTGYWKLSILEELHSKANQRLEK